MNNTDRAQYLKLFLKARRELFRAGRKADKESKHFRAALDFSVEHGIPSVFLEASYIYAIKDVNQASSLLETNDVIIPSEFTGLWEFVKGSLFNLLGNRIEAINTYQTALKDPNLDSPGLAWNNLGISLSELGRNREAIEAYQMALKDPNYDTPGTAWINLGTCLSDLDRHEEAIEAYQMALKDPNLDSPGSAWNNLGNTLSNLSRQEEAIEAYRRALNSPNYNSPGKAWYNLGNCLSKLSRYKEAIEAYEEALKDPNLDSPGLAWNNLGNMLSELGRHEEAIETYRNALEDPNLDSKEKVWNNLGVALRNLSRINEAIAAHEQVLTLPDPTGKQKTRAKALLRILESGLTKSSLSERDRSLTSSFESGGDSTIENRIIQKIEQGGVTQYDRYSQQESSKQQDVISILRGWCSSVTLLEGSHGKWRGGGYFLRWQGKGLAIDPGFDFLRNFHDAEYHGREIDAVFVSHNHPDHNSDLYSIDDLKYELYKRRNLNEKYTSKPYCILWDEDTSRATKFGITTPKHHYTPITCPFGYPQANDLSNSPWHLPFRITPFQVQHAEDVPKALGAVIELLDNESRSVFRIGYTGDTSYFDGLASNLQNCDVLIAHISQPKLVELQNPEEFHDSHLGYRGTIKLLKETKPKLALIGEFWAGFTDLRVDLVNALRERVETNNILPAGIGLNINLPNLDIQCSECKAPIDHKNIKVAPPPLSHPFGNLSYLCRQCMIY